MEKISIIIPVYNEELLLASQIRKLIKSVKNIDFVKDYEILLVNNGSSDATYKIAKTLSRTYPQIRVFHLPYPSYGQAFKFGIIWAKHPILAQFDLDFWDISFLGNAMKLIKRVNIVLGSKNLKSSLDGRSFSRKIISKLLEKVIKWRFNSKISDTHGLKILKRDIVVNQLPEIECSNHFFDSELLLRLEQEGYLIKELAVNLKEIRESRFPFAIRIAEAVYEFLQLLSIDLMPIGVRKNISGARLIQNITNLLKNSLFFAKISI